MQIEVNPDPKETPTERDGRTVTTAGCWVARVDVGGGRRLATYYYTGCYFMADADTTNWEGWRFDAGWLESCAMRLSEGRRDQQSVRRAVEILAAAHTMIPAPSPE